MAGKIEDILRASAEMAELQRVAPRLSRLRDVSLIHAKPYASTFSARADATLVIVKVFHGAYAMDLAKSASQAVLELNRRLPSGPNRVQEFVELLPKRGILITRFVEGPSMDHLLTSATSSEVLQLTDRAAEWLSVFAATQTDDDQFRPQYWRKRASERVAELSGSAQHDLAIQLLERIDTLAAKLEGVTIRRVRSHGDFSPQNLIFADDAVYGFDIRSLEIAPPQRDIASILVRLAVGNDVRSFPARHGISEALISPFLTRSGLASNPTNDRLLSFFLALTYADHLSWSRASADRARKTALNVEAFLADPGPA